MPPRKRDLTGQTFGRLTVKEFSHNNPRGAPMWLCDCACGRRPTIRAGSLVAGTTSSCGCLAAEKARLRCSAGGPRSPAWRGGKQINAQGYVLLYASGHPRATKHNTILEHRLVMERAIGRPLLRDEIVHHKNGDRKDNRLENLELWSHGQPTGERIEDKVQWAKEILSRYEPGSLSTQAVTDGQRK